MDNNIISRLSRIWSPASKITPEELEEISAASILEAEDKKQRLLDFYRDPYSDESTRWWLPEFNLHYLEQSKSEGQKRKDKGTENILHEFNPLLLMRGYWHAKMLPDLVVSQVLNGKNENLPKAQQPIYRLFNVESIHDLDEDDPDVSPDKYRKFMFDRIEEETKIPPGEKDFLKEVVEFDTKALEAITFGRKTRDSKERVIEIPTHGNDRQIYTTAMEEDWAAIGAKGPDRGAEGLTTRYGEIPDFFTVEQDLDYLDETRRLFMHRQVLEEMQERYPELNIYFATINAMMNVTYRCLDSITLHHPTKLKMDPDDTVRPETAQIHIEAFLDDATHGYDHLNADEQPLLRMLRGYEFEAVRHPELTNLVTQMQKQIGPHLKDYKPLDFSTSTPEQTPSVDLRLET